MSRGVGVQTMSPGIGTNPQEKGIVSGGNTPLRVLLCINVGWLGRVLMQFETCQSWIAELVSHYGSSSAILVFSFPTLSTQIPSAG